jgi:hypothetical protein
MNLGGGQAKDLAVVEHLVRPIMRRIRGKEPQSLALADQLRGAEAVRDRD